MTTRKDSEVLKEQLRLMAERIMEEGARMPEEDLVIAFDNGGGQTGIRENPYYPAYEKLLASYTKTLDAVKNIAGEDTEVRNLEDLRSRFRVAK